MPYELAFKIVDYLDIKTLLNCICTCKSWKTLIESDAAQNLVWRKRILLEGFADLGNFNHKIEKFKSRWHLYNYTNLFKSFYVHQYKTRQNWILGRNKKTSFPAHGESVVTCLHFDDEKIITGSDDQTIQMYDIQKGALSARFEGHEGGVWALQYWNTTLVSGSTDRTVRVWYIKTNIGI